MRHDSTYSKRQVIPLAQGLPFINNLLREFENLFVNTLRGHLSTRNLVKPIEIALSITRVEQHASDMVPAANAQTKHVPAHFRADSLDDYSTGARLATIFDFSHAIDLVNSKIYGR